jgi:hypothetical protein
MEGPAAAQFSLTQPTILPMAPLKSSPRFSIFAEFRRSYLAHRSPRSANEEDFQGDAANCAEEGEESDGGMLPLSIETRKYQSEFVRFC